MQLIQFDKLACAADGTASAELRDVRRIDDGYALMVADGQGQEAMLIFRDAEVGGLMIKLAAAKAKRL